MSFKNLIRAVGRLLLVAFLSGAVSTVSGLSAAPVHADEIQSCASSANQFSDAGARSGVSSIAPNSQLLPQERWGDSASRFHTRLDADAWNDLPEKVTRNILINQSLAFGNAMYSIGTGLVGFAADFDVLCAGAPQADQAAATIGNAILASPLLVAVVVCGIVMLIARSMKGSERPWKKFAQMAITVGVLAGMTFAAGQSQVSSSGPGELGRGSPGWFMDRANSFITAAGSLGPGALQSSMDSSGDAINNVADATNPQPDCGAYIRGLREQYATAGASRTPLTRYKASVSLTMSTMWEQSGMRVWEIAQFGYTDAGRRVGCRLLEDFSGTPSSEQRARTVAACAGACPGEPSVDAFEMDSNKAQDWAIIAWASCRGSGGGWAITSEFSGVYEDEAAAVEACGTAWSEGERIPNDDVPSFNFENESEIKEATSDAPAARQFLLNFQGHASSSALAASIGFVFSSALVMLCFGALAFAVIIGKMLVVAMIPMLLIALAMSIWPGRADNAKVVKIAKFAFGAMVFSVMYYFLLSLVALFSGIIATAGASALGEGSLLGSLWIGLAPVIAIVLLHLMSKSAGVPSPFKPTAALGYAAALAGTGAAIGIGADRMLSGAGRSMRRSISRRNSDRRLGAAIAGNRGGGSVSTADRPRGRGGMGAGPSSTSKGDKGARDAARGDKPESGPTTKDGPSASAGSVPGGGVPGTDAASAAAAAATASAAAEKAFDERRRDASSGTGSVPVAGDDAAGAEPGPLNDFGRRRGMVRARLEDKASELLERGRVGAPGSAARQAREVAAAARGSNRRVLSSRPGVAAAAGLTAAGTLAAAGARRAVARTRSAADVREPAKAARAVRTGVKAAAFGGAMVATGGLAIPAAAAAWGASRAIGSPLARQASRAAEVAKAHRQAEGARVQAATQSTLGAQPQPRQARSQPASPPSPQRSEQPPPRQRTASPQRGRTAPIPVNTDGPVPAAIPDGPVNPDYSPGVVDRTPPDQPTTQP